MQRIYELIQRASAFDFSVLILGESGTGKELVARSVHDLGSRRHQPFVPVDCAALSPSLAESELFGHAKGAFTDALRDRTGLFEIASGGTLFLDEIGELPLTVQVKLLRALQEKEIRQVGSNRQIRTNARIIAATNRNLEVCVRDGSFRQDLYFRLNVVQIRLPALRERRVDIPLLVAYFLHKFSGPLQPVRAISDDALRQLMAYDWPGNVRELENAIECAVALSADSVLTTDDLASVHYRACATHASESNEFVPLVEMERRAIVHALQETGGNKHAAARRLGIGKTTIYRKLKEYARASSRRAASRQEC